MRANSLVERYVLVMPLMDLWNLAAAILHAKVDGYEPEKKSPVEAQDETTGADGSTTLAP